MNTDLGSDIMIANVQFTIIECKLDIESVPFYKLVRKSFEQLNLLYSKKKKKISFFEISLKKHEVAIKWAFRLQDRQMKTSTRLMYSVETYL